MFEYKINSGIPAYEITEFFQALAVTSDEKKRIFVGDGWEVRLVELPDDIHRSIIIPRTMVIFRGEQDPCEKLIEIYRKTLMRGGG
jgi:hypothetical protein